VSVQKALDTAEARGLLERDLKRIAPSEKGRLFLNELLQLFLPNSGTEP
jgi:coproporphyrinogen III oxidase-like Fe-S oxidoreductase